MPIRQIFLTSSGVTALASLVIGAFFIFGPLLFVGEILDADHSVHWPTAPGIVEAYDVQHGCGSFSLYRVQLIYRYIAAGAQRKGHRITATSQCFHTRKGAEAFLLRSYPIGAVVDVYFNPDDPDSALLRPGPSSKVGYLIVGAFWVFGAALLGAGVLLLRRALDAQLLSDRDPDARTRPILRATVRVSLRWRRTQRSSSQPKEPR